MNTSTETRPDRSTAASTRVLAVADWSVDPDEVARFLPSATAGETVFGVLVPSRLSVMEWIGDPHASRPCAQRQLETIRSLSRSRQTEIEFAGVGDPERVAAVTEALEAWRADRVILFEPRRWFSGAFRWSVAARIERRHGLPVERIRVSCQSRWTSLRSGRWRRAPRCRPALVTEE